jgi:hypothetical protein
VVHVTCLMKETDFQFEFRLTMMERRSLLMLKTKGDSHMQGMVITLSLGFNALYATFGTFKEETLCTMIEVTSYSSSAFGEHLWMHFDREKIQRLGV